MDPLPLHWVFGLYLGDCILQATKASRDIREGSPGDPLIQETASSLIELVPKKLHIAKITRTSGDVRRFTSIEFKCSHYNVEISDL